MATQFRVNGEAVSVEAAPDTPLLLVLRNDLGLNGAKFGCGLAQCGACRVIVGGEIAPSCATTLGEVSGRDVETLEGLGTATRLHPLQRAFYDERAAQCGYCTAGMVMAAKALLDRNADPSDEEIRQALERNLCRCGAYPRILRAVRRAARELAR